MCLIFIFINSHPAYKLIVAANRDEFYKRETAAAAYWTDYPDVLGGRDLAAHGTWMAMTQSGKIGMVTNYRDLKNINPNAPSRGRLISDYLVNGYGAEDYIKDVHLTASKYNGFNLVIGKLDELYYYSNYQSKTVKLYSGVFGLSNHLLDTPWPKVKRGKEKIYAVISKSTIQPDAFFEVLRDEETAPDSQLPDTGLDLETEKALSAMFIKTPDYGSRCSTVILIDRDNKVNFTERVYNPDTFEFDQKNYQFEII